MISVHVSEEPVAASPSGSGADLFTVCASTHSITPKIFNLVKVDGEIGYHLCEKHLPQFA
jgi:hypothetical protein